MLRYGYMARLGGASRASAYRTRVLSSSVDLSAINLAAEGHTDDATKGTKHYDLAVIGGTCAA